MLSYELALHGRGMLCYKTALQEGSIPIAVSDIIFLFQEFCCVLLL